MRAPDIALGCENACSLAAQRRSRIMKCWSICSTLQ